MGQSPKGRHRTDVKEAQIQPGRLAGDGQLRASCVGYAVFVLMRFDVSPTHDCVKLLRDRGASSEAGEVA